MEVIGCRTRAAPHPDCARVVAAAGLDAELPEADAVVLAAPLTPATRNLLDARRIGLLGPARGWSTSAAALPTQFHFCISTLRSGGRS